MHIAVCMDVAADRKQLERLLERSTDRRLLEDNSIPFYIQSYGNKSALLARPFMYDLFFIDILTDNVNSLDLIRQLRKIGVTATIVLCPSKVDLTDEITKEDDVLILKQPILKNELEEVLDVAIEKVKTKVRLLDIGGLDTNYHILPEEFLYAEKQKDRILVHLSDGREILSYERIDIFWDRAQTFDPIYYLPPNIVVNKDAVVSTKFSSVVLSDGRKFHVNREWLKLFESISE